MDFETRFSSVLIKLRDIAAKYSSFCRYADKEDLFAEMRLHLWYMWKKGSLENRTESYITQSCYFYIRNYLRTANSRAKLVSFEEINGFASGNPDDRYGHWGNRPEDTLNDGLPGIGAMIESNALYEKIMNNGLSTLEKDIVRYIYSGYTVREIGKMLGISHVMVVKRKRSIAEKVTSRYGNLLV